ncbi:MAG: LytTR family DNA-binding domain-containing protein [Clostridium sp.]|nr:LytTR family DNA-binding domain-containing protein [Clostridium sp.]
MLKIAVVDDDIFILKKVCSLIDKHIKQDKSIDQFSNDIEFFNNLNKFSYDMVFLDIDMPQVNGFVIAGDLKVVNPNIAIIFVSNMENLIADSIRYKPLAFIRKSRMEQDLINNLDLMQNILSETNEKFFVEINGINTEISLKDIVYFESENHDLYVQTLYNNYRKKRVRDNELNLKKLFEQYKKDGFILVSRNYLVNYKYIDVIGRDKIILKNNAKIIVSPRNVSDIKRIYQQFLMTGGIL